MWAQIWMTKKGILIIAERPIPVLHREWVHNVWYMASSALLQVLYLCQVGADDLLFPFKQLAVVCFKEVFLGHSSTTLHLSTLLT